MKKEIPVSDLKLGMYVVQYGEGSFISPVTLVNRVMGSVEDIQALRNQGVDMVIVDESKSASANDSPVSSSQSSDNTTPSSYFQPSLTYSQEIDFAKKAYGQALKFVENMFDSIRHGASFDYKDAEPFADDLVQTTSRNSLAATSLAIMRYEGDLQHHSVNVALLAGAFAHFLGLPESHIRKLILAGLFHDIGKVRISNSIWNKPGKLNDKEFAEVKLHPVIGYRLLSEQEDMDRDIAHAVLDHHEAINGSGYPNSKEGDDIHIFARVLSLVDIYDALASDRPYRLGMPPDEVVRCLYAQRKTRFFRDMLERFVRFIGFYPVGSFVHLSDGRYGVVTNICKDSLFTPTVRVVLDRRLRPMRPESIDLAEQDTKTVTGGLSIKSCLNPGQYKVDVERLMAGWH
ncbi:MAG: HD-GYP domain-containing protein [Desulfovibrio sp.]